MLIIIRRTAIINTLGRRVRQLVCLIVRSRRMLSIKITILKCRGHLTTPAHQYLLTMIILTSEVKMILKLNVT